MTVHAKGRFKTTEELVEKVLFLYHFTALTMDQVAANCEVTSNTALKIVREYPKPSLVMGDGGSITKA